MDLVHVEKGDPAHVARHDVAELQEGVASPHAEGGIPAQLGDLAAQLLDLVVKPEYFAHPSLQHECSRLRCNECIDTVLYLNNMFVTPDMNGLIK